LGAIASALVPLRMWQRLACAGRGMIDARVKSHAWTAMYRTIPTRANWHKFELAAVDAAGDRSGLALRGLWPWRSWQGKTNVTVDYYSAPSKTAALQIGGAAICHVTVLMTKPPKSVFPRPLWACGPIWNMSLGPWRKAWQQTRTSACPVVGGLFGRAGLRLGATLEGTNNSRIIPKGYARTLHLCGSGSFSLPQSVSVVETAPDYPNVATHFTELLYRNWFDQRR